jgi:predicted methyltransferase
MSDVLLDEYNVLRVSGILDAYEYFLKLLCKNGLPTGRVYDYAAQEIEKFEKRKITKELKMRAELDIQKITKKNSSSRVSPERDPSPYYQ